MNADMLLEELVNILETIQDYGLDIQDMLDSAHAMMESSEEATLYSEDFSYVMAQQARWCYYEDLGDGMSLLATLPMNGPTARELGLKGTIECESCGEDKEWAAIEGWVCLSAVYPATTCDAADKRLLVAIAELAGYEDVVCLDDPEEAGKYILISQNVLDVEATS